MQVLSFNIAAARAGISLRTFQRLAALGEGPTTVMLSERRRGVLEPDFERWLLSRRRPAPGERKEA